MSGPNQSGGAAAGLFLLADISGYTGFLQAVGTAHRDDAFANGQVPPAYPLMSTLLEGIIGRLVPPFTLSKLEGDAVFAFAVDPDEVPRDAAVLPFLQATYDAFRAQLAALEQALTCRCDACSRGAALDLKFVLHAGGFVMQSIGGGRELVGPDVVMAHRLLKNGGAALLGHAAYALLTDAAVARLQVPVTGSAAMTETYDHYAPIEVRLFPLR
jgi:hypothetical protein